MFVALCFPQMNQGKVPCIRLANLTSLSLQGDSASRSLLSDLNSRGWSVVDLAELARKANVLEVVQILADYCKGVLYGT